MYLLIQKIKTSQLNYITTEIGTLPVSLKVSYFHANLPNLYGLHYRNMIHFAIVSCISYKKKKIGLNLKKHKVGAKSVSEIGPVNEP